jgi:hypothetical protein
MKTFFVGPKKTNALFLSGLLILTGSFARASVSDFHSLINDSIEAKKELTQKLQKNVKTNNSIADRSTHKQAWAQDGDSELTENIVSRGQGHQASGRDATSAIKPQAAKIEKDSMKRLSEEFKDAE